MSGSACSTPAQSAGRGIGFQAPWPLRLLASLKLAVALLMIVSAVLAVTTFIEAAKGRDYVLWHVYHTPWFAGLLGLLCANVLAAMIVRFPCKWNHVPFLATHAGLLVLMAGSVWTFRSGIEGRLVLGEGETSDRIILTDRCQFSVHWMEGHGRQDRWPAAFSFRPGPVDWPEGKTLDLGEGSGVHLKLIRFYRHAELHDDWVADESKTAPPALKFAVAAQGGTAGEGQWLVADPFLSEASMGPLQFVLQRAPVSSILEDFLKPPEKDLDPSGVLAIHHEGRVTRIPVGPNVGKKVPLGKSRISVEIAEYLPNAKAVGDLRFASEGKEPNNPLLELRVHEADKKEPIRQVAFAAHPFQSFEGIHGRSCPVKFWYHHPAIKAPAGIEFLQAPDGKLYCRVGKEGKYEVRGEVKAGDQVESSGMFRVELLDYVPHARRQVTYQPVEASEEGAGPEAAACLEASVGGETREVWLQRNDKERGIQTLVTRDGPLAIGFANERYPLGYSLRLEKFERGVNPGGMGDASFTSVVRLMDKTHEIDEEREIWMNHPLAHGDFVFYQSSFDESSEGTAVSIFTVAHDPGRWLKYVGSLLACVGTLLVFFRKAGLLKLPVTGRCQADTAGEDSPGVQDRALTELSNDGAGRAESTSRAAVKSIALVFAVLCLSQPALAGGPSESGIDWKAWQTLPVQSGGRRKPLDTFAGESLRMISNRASFRDPETGRSLDATELYLSMLFDYQEGKSADSTKPAGSHGAANPRGVMGHPGATGPHGAISAGGMGSPHGSMLRDPRAAFFRAREPDQWDRAPLIYVGSRELRNALGMADGQKHISPCDLAEAEVEEPQSHIKVRFTMLAKRISFRLTPPSAKFEKAIMEVATRLWAYQDHRMGQKLEIAPLPGSESQQWASVAFLTRARLDDNNDPGGKLRQVRDKFQQARTAYLAGDPVAFQEASTEFLTTAREVGTELGEYPESSTIDLEVAYNHWAPFRFAWLLMLIACLGVLASMATGRNALYLGAVTIFLAAVVAMLIGFGMRVAISGRAPVTNMYESVVYVAFGAAVLGLFFALIYRNRAVLAASAAISTLALVLADSFPVALDPSLQPLPAILRSNYWLLIHVMTVTASYAAFATAWIIGNVALGYYLVRSKNRATMDTLNRVLYWTLLVGVFLLEVGTVLGAMWADDSWGRFWSWDRKEVWALITLLIYLAVLHARPVAWIGHRGLAALSALGFALVLMAWYGVNLMGSGSLHSYGFTGVEGQALIAGGLLSVQFIYVGLAMLRTPPTSTTMAPASAA